MGRNVYKRTIYFDMDGVLAQWNSRATMDQVMSPTYFLFRRRQWNMILAALVMAVAGHITHAWKVAICTCSPSRAARISKRSWLFLSGLGFIPVVFVPDGERKSDYINEDNALLIDDFGKNLSEWSGIPVKFYNGINGHGRTRYLCSIDHKMSTKTIVRNVLKFAA